MSDDPKPKAPGLFQQLRTQANVNYLILAATGLFVYFLLMSGKGNDTGALIALLIAIPGILARWTAAPILVLLLSIFMLIDPGFMNSINFVTGGRRMFFGTPSGFRIEDGLLAAAMLAYSVGHYRLTAIVTQAMPLDRGFRGDREPVKPPARPADSVPGDELPRFLFVLALCVVVGQLIWSLLIYLERSARPQPFPVGVNRMMILVWVAGIVVMLTSGIVIYLRSMRMSRAEAEMRLRDTHFHETLRETDRLHRWRQWFKQKVALQRRKK